MSKLFITILNNALVAGWIILAVIILRLLLKKSPKWINCVLWGLVAVRLLVPFSIESIFSLVPSSKPVPVDIEYVTVPQIDSGINTVNTVINPMLENNFTATETASVNPMQIVVGIFSYIWIVGVISLLVYAFVSFILLKRQIKDVKPVAERVYECSTVESPFILGILRPVIYIPDSLEENAYSCVIEHEKAHLKRGDFIWKPLGFLLLSVYWFNPLCWIAFIMLCKDIEYACDEKVTKDKDRDWKAQYCQILLNLSSQRKLISACPVAFGEVSVKDRVKSVINYKKPAFWIITVSIIACIIVGICFLTNPKAGDIKLLDNASPETSAMSFHYFDGEKTEIKWLYDEKEEQKIIDDINILATKKNDSSRIAEFTTPCYGLEISDKDGYMIWLTYCNGLWLNKDGSIYEAKYNFEKLYKDVHSDSTEIMSGGSGMTNAGLLGEYDVRYYSKASEMSSQRNGVELSISAIEDNTVTILIQNKSSEDFIYGTYYSLHKEIDGVWYVLPPKLSNYGFTDIAYVMPVGENREEQCDLTMYGELLEGHYRIEKEGMVAEFSVKDKSIFFSSHGTNIAITTDEKRGAFDAYYQLIHAIETAMYDSRLREKNPDSYKDFEGNEICSSEFFVHLYDGKDDIAYQNLGYTILDIDGDDVPELLLGANDPAPNGTYNGVIYDLYSYKNGKIKHIFSGWPRNAYYLLEGSNEFVCVWSNSADDNGKTYYQYAEGELKEVVGSEKEHVVFSLCPMGPTWQQVDDLNGDGRADYVIYPYMDGFSNVVRLYLTGEGTIFEHGDEVATEIGKIVSAVDMDSDGEKEIVLSFEPHVNSMPLEEFAVLKKIDGVWKELEQHTFANGNNSFPLKIVHDKDFNVQISCDGIGKTIVFDTKIFYENWKNDGSEKEQKYYEELSILPEGTPVGRILDWGIWNVSLSTYGGDICLVAEQGIASDNQEDLWGTASIFFNYDINGKINILDISFSRAAQEEEENESEIEGFDNGITYSGYTDELIFNFGGRFFLSDTFEKPLHGEGAPTGWYALGGEGKCIDPSYSEREILAGGKLIAYNWLDNHSDCQKIMPFSVGNYSCCLYQYLFDLFTVPELEQHSNVDRTSDYWVVFLYRRGRQTTVR